MVWRSVCLKRGAASPPAAPGPRIWFDVGREMIAGPRALGSSAEKSRVGSQAASSGWRSDPGHLAMPAPLNAAPTSADVGGGTSSTTWLSGGFHVKHPGVCAVAAVQETTEHTRSRSEVLVSVFHVKRPNPSQRNGGWALPRGGGVYVALAGRFQASHVSRETSGPGSIPRRDRILHGDLQSVVGCAS